MKRNKPLTVIIDTNFWISFLISHRQDRLYDLLAIERIKILFSEELLDEISVTITKPKIKKHFGANALEEMLLKLDPYIKLVTVHTKINICRDVKDNFLLGLAKDGDADYLLTGDNDLLTLKKSGKTAIITITDFFDKISN